MSIKNGVYNKYIFNFSSSVEGGGLKRLLAFVQWFNKEGGACFIVNSKLKHLFEQDKINSFFYIDTSKFDKFINNLSYVNKVIELIEECHLYYSYNIPINRDICALYKWYHLSNILPFFNPFSYKIPFLRSIELWWLGKLIKRNLHYTDVVSAESVWSLDQIPNHDGLTKILSVNGADFELTHAQNFHHSDDHLNIAVVVGTYFHKNLLDSYSIYKYLRIKNPKLKLIVIGPKGSIPDCMLEDHMVILKGVLDHNEVCMMLKKSLYYISTTLIENSWNAASEGVLLANKSYVSDIPPHRELFNDPKVIPLQKFMTSVKILEVDFDTVNFDKLKTWDQIVEDMICHISDFN